MKNIELRGKYDPWCYDERLCLKVPFLLAVSIIYLARHLLMPVVVFAVSRKSQSSDMFYLINGLHELSFLVTSLPAVAVILAWAKRCPGSRSYIRWIWQKGRWFLACSALLDLALRLVFTANFLKGFVIAACLLDIYILVYLFVSARVRDVFFDFQKPDDMVVKL